MIRLWQDYDKIDQSYDKYSDYDGSIRFMIDYYMTIVIGNIEQVVMIRLRQHHDKFYKSYDKYSDSDKIMPRIC